MHISKALVGLMFWVSSEALAGVSANPTRPTFSDNANPMAAGHLELELGGQVWEQADAEHIATPFLIKLGLADFAEFKVGGQGLRYIHDDQGEDHIGFGNMGLFAKLRFLQQSGRAPAIAGLFAVMLPTASDEVGGGTIDFSALLITSGSFGPMGWDFNVGIDIYGLDQDDQVLDVPLILALSASQILGPFGVIMEVADYIPLSDQDNRLHLLGAVTCAITPRFILDFAFVKGFDGAPDWEVHIGLTSTLARLW